MKAFLTNSAYGFLTALSVQAACARPLPSDSLQVIPLTLTQVWEKTELYSKAVKIRQLRYQSSLEKVKDARAERLPEVAVNGNYARITNMPVYSSGILEAPSQFPVLHSTYTAAGEAYLNLYNGSKTNLEIQASKSEGNIALEQEKLTASETRLRAAGYYLSMQRSQIFRELLLKDIAAQEKQLQQIRTLQKNGVVLKSDVLRAELKLSRQKLSVVELSNDLVLANQKLNSLIGLPDEQVVSTVDTLQTLLPVKAYADYLTDAGNNAYQLSISAQETELRRLQLKKIRANVSPKVGMFAEYSYSYPQIFLAPYSPYIYGLGLAGIKASFSVSSLYQNYHKAKAARLDYESQQVEHAATEDVIRQQVKEGYLRYQEAITRVEVTRTNIRQATENLRIIRNTYFNQLSLITDLLDADTQLLQTRFDLAAAEISARLQYYQLQHITGKL